VRGEQKPEPRAIDACVVAGDGQVADAGVAQGKNELFGDATKTESADGHEHAVADDAFECRFRVGEELVHRGLVDRGEFYG
jgi:hypothetical protein